MPMVNVFVKMAATVAMVAPVQAQTMPKTRPVVYVVASAPMPEVDEDTQQDDSTVDGSEETRDQDVDPVDKDSE